MNQLALSSPSLSLSRPCELISWAFLLALTIARGVSLCPLLACRVMCVSVMSRSALGSSLCLPELRYCLCFPCTVLLQHGADANIRNTDGKSALDLAEPSAKAVLTGESTDLSFFICPSLLSSGWLSVSLSVILLLTGFQMFTDCFVCVCICAFVSFQLY